MKKLIIAGFIVLTIFIFGSALTSSADEYYYFDKGRGHSIERHGGRERGYRPNIITPSNPFDNELGRYYHNDRRNDRRERYYYDDDYDHYYYYERDFDDDGLEFKLDIL